MGKQHLSRDERLVMKGKLQGMRECMDMVAMVLIDKCGWHVQEATADNRDTQSIADFVYERRTAPDNYGQRYWLPVVEDVKGMRTRDYALKAKLFRSRYGFAIREV